MAVEYLPFSKKQGCPSTSKKGVSMKDGDFRDDILLIQQLNFYHLQWLFHHGTFLSSSKNFSKRPILGWTAGLAGGNGPPEERWRGWGFTVWVCFKSFGENACFSQLPL